MGMVADAVLADGGEVIGVIPRALVDRELAHPRLTELVVADTMHERKQRMHDLSDGFIALPGGFGTLDELFEALTWAQLGMHGKPCGLLDVDGFWEPLRALVERQVAEEFVRAQHAMMLLHNNDPDALLDAFAGYRAARGRSGSPAATSSSSLHARLQRMARPFSTRFASRGLVRRSGFSIAAPAAQRQQEPQSPMSAPATPAARSARIAVVTMAVTTKTAAVMATARSMPPMIASRLQVRSICSLSRTSRRQWRRW